MIKYLHLFWYLEAWPSHVHDISRCIFPTCFQDFMVWSKGPEVLPRRRFTSSNHGKTHKWSQNCHLACECGENIRKIWELDGKKNMNLGCIYSVYIRIPYTAWLIITCLWRMHQEHAGPCHVAWKPALWTQPLNLDQDVTWNQGVHSEQMGISGLWGPKSCFSKLHQLEPATKGCAFYHVITIWCLLISSKLAY
jgi:hypothetical protein